MLPIFDPEAIEIISHIENYRFFMVIVAVYYSSADVRWLDSKTQAY